MGVMTADAEGIARVPIVSVVIPTYNRLPRLHRVLAALAEQTVDGAVFEVVVVSDGSTDGTDDYLVSDRPPIDVRALHQSNQGPAAARNAGVAAARGRLLLFLDDDVVPSATLVERHLDAHDVHGPGVVVLGPMLTPDDHAMSPWVAYEQAMLDKQYRAMRAGVWEPTARQFYTGNASLGRSHVVAAGGFDTSFSRAEDVELAYRLAAHGLRFVFDPDAVGLHYAERSYTSWRRTPYLYGRNDVIFGRDRGQAWLLPQIRREFDDHHRLIRLATTATVDRPGLRKVVVHTCEAVARVSAGRVRRAALSAVYNLMYYQGITDELASSRWLTADETRRAVTAGSS